MVDSIRGLVVWAETRPDGTPFHEELLVEAQSNGQFSLLRSPAFAQGLAAGDVFVLDHQKRPILRSRGGNLAVQVFDRAGVAWVRSFIEADIVGLGGTVDGESAQVIVLTVPVTAGFEAIEAVLNRIPSKSPSAHWYFGNVYDPADGVTPLNWWRDVPRRSQYSYE